MMSNESGLVGFNPTCNYMAEVEQESCNLLKLLGPNDNCIEGPQLLHIINKTSVFLCEKGFLTHSRS